MYGVFIISYIIATVRGPWGFVILGIVVTGIVIYVVETMVTSFGVEKPHKKHRYSKIKKSKISYEFKELYNHIENEYASELEENRKKLLKSIIICFILFIMAFVLFIMLDVKTKFGRKIIAIPFVPAVMYYTFKYKNINKIYTENFKEKIIKNFVKYINNSLTYHQYGGKSLIKHYLDAQFEDKEFNKINTDDYIEGYNNNNTNIQMCNISLENVNSNGEFLNLIYEGIFSVSQLNINVSNEIRIKKKSYIIKNNHNKVEMDSKEFEKYFDVYSDSNILAMQILTHDIMEEITQFYSNYKIAFEIIIKNKIINIRFDTGVMFEPNILKKSNDINMLWVYYNILEFVINFTFKINKLLKDLEV